MTPRQFLYGASVLGGALLGGVGWILCFLAVSWLVCAYQWPMAPCWKCRGKKVNKGSSKKRYGACKPCKGSGTRQVTGSKQVHQAVRSMVAYRKKEK